MNREAILTALAARIDARRAPWPSIPAYLPYTLLADGQETVTDRQYDQALLTLILGVRRAARATSDATRSSEANALLEALIVETLGTDRTLGGECLDLYYLEGNTEYPTDGTDLIGATAVFAVDYARDFE